MVKVFVDTNVILDHALDRVFADEAERILSMSERGEMNCYISAGAVYTLAYVLEKAIKNVDSVREKLLQYLGLVTPVSNLPHIFEKAICDKSFSDIEDAFQYYAALQVGCDYFITGNINDFKKGKISKLPVFKPDEFLIIIS